MRGFEVVGNKLKINIGMSFVEIKILWMPMQIRDINQMTFVGFKKWSVVETLTNTVVVLSITKIL